MNSISSLDILHEINKLIYSQDYNFFVDMKNQNNKLGDEYNQSKNMFLQVFRSKKL
jgi:hypothetical protein